MLRNLCLLICLMPFFAHAGSGNETMYSYQIGDGSWISLRGTTNINSYSCTSTGEIPRGYIMADILPGSNAIYFSDAFLDLRVPSFDCKNRLMNADLHEALGGDDNSYIKIKLLEARTKSNFKEGNQGQLITQVEIWINGKSKITDITVDYDQVTPYSFLITGSKDLKMSEFDITPPSPMLGMVKVHNQVTIHFHLIVETSLISQSQ